jgi:CRP/FNR family transcriptional regulator
MAVINAVESGVSDATSLIADCRAKQFCAKDVLYREGGTAAGVYRIRAGMVKLLSYLPNGRARIIRLHSPDHWIGLESILGQPYEHTAVAVEDVDAQFVSLEKLRLLRCQEPAQFAEILTQVYAHLVEADRWIAEFSTGGIKPRVARLIEFLSRFERSAAAGVVELLTVHEMADILGVTAESVSRTLALFKRSQILTKQGSGHTYTFDSRKLRYVAQE